MNFEKLEQEARGGPIEVKGFDRGLFWVVPDPKDLANVEAHTERYNQGFFISYECWNITEAQYNDPSFWN